MVENKTSGNSTADDGLGRHKKQLTPEQMAENDKFDIGPWFIHLYMEEPFFSRIYRAVNRTQDRKIVPTAGVGIIDERPTFLWNPDFVASLPDAHILGLLKHEAYHLIYNHCTSRRMEPHIFWNWAADLSINCVINAKELPDGGLVPGKPLKRPAPETWSAMNQQEQQRFEKISSLIQKMPVEMTAEWYFSALMDDDEIKQMMKEADAAKSMAKALGEALSKALAEGTGLDEHEIWGKAIDSKTGEMSNLPDGQRQLIEGELREALKEAINNCDGGNKWGSVPQNMQRHLRSLVSNEVNWRDILRQFVGRSRRAEARNSRKKVDRKNEAIRAATGISHAFPGRARAYHANIAVYVDQSGSVDDRSLELLYGELRSLSKRVTFHFYPFDTEVDETNGFVWKKGQQQAQLERFRCGGTDFQACVNHAAKNRDKFDGILIMTDGQCGKPTPSRVRLAYVICPGNSLIFEPHRGELVINMKGD